MPQAASPPSAVPERLRFKRLSLRAIPPVRSSSDAAGYDLYSATDVVVPAGGRWLIPTDLAFQFPAGCYGRIAPRSGLAYKFYIDVGAGVIDPDYRGNVCVLLYNFSEFNFNVRRGDRIAQLILERYCAPAHCEEVESLEDSYRGVEGFGSTGVHGAPPTYGDCTLAVSNMVEVPEPENSDSNTCPF
nr:dUTP pyrophosphatase [Tawny frogmouth aviadenovirus A]